MHSSVPLTVSILLYSRSPEHLHLPKLKLGLQEVLTLPSVPSPWQPPLYLLSLCFDESRILHKWNHRVFVFLWLAYLIWHNGLKVHPCYSRCHMSFLFKAEYPTLRTTPVLSPHSPVCGCWVAPTPWILHVTLRRPWACRHLLDSSGAMSVDLRFTFLWMYTQTWKGSIILTSTFTRLLGLCTSAKKL